MPQTVLFVDDDLSVLSALMRRMRKESFALRTSTSAEEALRILAQSPIDLVVSDMHMPAMSGLEFLSNVATNHPKCIRIMLTGQPSLPLAMDAINSGHVYRFLTKPFDAEALARLIREALELRPLAPQIEASVDQGLNGVNGRKSFGGTFAQLEPNDGVAYSMHGADLDSGLSKKFFENVGKPGFKARIKQYEIHSVIGQGAMGIVLKAHDPGLNRDVALKFVSPEWAGSTSAHQRFVQEARCAANIRHENVVSIFAISDVGGIPFLVMEYVPGCSLEDRLVADEKLTIAEILRIGRQIALGLAAAHDLRVIHRDIKPANILLEARLQGVRITDFGLARAMDCDQNLSQQGQLLGTPRYMSPEQVDGKSLTPATDLFSLGSVLYTLCTGDPPFERESLSKLLHAIAEETPTPIRTLNAAVPERLAKVIEKLHAKMPGERFPSAKHAADALR